MMKLHKLTAVQEILDCSDDQVDKLIKSGDLVAVNIGVGQRRRCLRVTDNELQAFLERRTIGAAPKRKKATAPKPSKEWV